MITDIVKSASSIVYRIDRYLMLISDFLKSDKVIAETTYGLAMLKWYQVDIKKN